MSLEEIKQRRKSRQQGTTKVCQKCLSKLHWTYECHAAERAYASRPSRSKLLSSGELERRITPAKPPEQVEYEQRMAAFEIRKRMEAFGNKRIKQSLESRPLEARPTDRMEQASQSVADLQEAKLQDEMDVKDYESSSSDSSDSSDDSESSRKRRRRRRRRHRIEND